MVGLEQLRCLQVAEDVRACVDGRLDILQPSQKTKIVRIYPRSLLPLVWLVQATDELQSRSLAVTCEDMAQFVEKDGILVHDLCVPLLYQPCPLRVCAPWTAWVTVVYHRSNFAQIGHVFVMLALQNGGLSYAVARPHRARL